MATNRANVLDDELMRAVRQVVLQVLASHGPHHNPSRKRRGGDFSSTTNLTKFAHVIEEAAKDGGSIGRCVLLNEDMQAEDAEGNELILDESEEGFDQTKIDAVALEFKSAHVYAACAEETRITVHSEAEITPGSSFEDRKVWGLLVDMLDYLATRPGFEANGILWAGDGAGPDSIDFEYEECEE